MLTNEVSTKNAVEQLVSNGNATQRSDASACAKGRRDRKRERTISVLNKNNRSICLIFCTQPTKINQIPMKTFTPTYIPNIHEHLSVLPIFSQKSRQIECKSEYYEQSLNNLKFQVRIYFFPFLPFLPFLRIALRLFRYFRKAFCTMRAA